MSYVAKKFDHLLGIAGFSDQLLKNHFTLYEGYVANTNKLLNLFGEKDPASPEFAELKRRFGWEWNGMRLHELYFENLTKDPKALDEESELAKKILTKFESLEKWAGVFKAIGTMRGIGWVVLYWDKEADKIFNVWINEHDGGHLAGCVPLLVMDVFEHSYMLDYQLKKADYIDSFLKAIDWEVVNKRLSA
jgi:Fe-Mn family superoxide dismutase